ncbi:MAG: 50S ribosomal protein L15 [Bacteroidales bacterium]|nr:50S ribosomal protein L15 [Bacteroidales bacterium]
MDLSNLQPNPGSTHSKTRIGRGPGSGKGGTSTRGHKGAKSRSGYKRKIGFEGGQMPLQRRLPKFGFKPLARIEYRPINLEKLQELAEAKNLEKIGLEELRAAGMINRKHLVKILAKGELNKALTVEAHAFSKAAQEAIEKAGGTIVKIEK